jgi:hypothetical protein
MCVSRLEGGLPDGDVDEQSPGGGVDRERADGSGADVQRRERRHDLQGHRGGANHHTAVFHGDGGVAETD